VIEKAFTLQTDLFNSAAPAADFINPRCFGQDFALWLKDRLQKYGLSSSEPVQEDWGWVLLVPYRGHRFTVSIGVVEGSLGRTRAEWRVGVVHEKAVDGVRAWFRRHPEAELSELSQLLEDMLRSDTRIEELAPA
jgi:hypothetical protein